MNRRKFVKTGIAAGVTVSKSPSTLAASAPTRRRPNVLYVFDDEHRAQSMPGEPFSDAVVAPNLDAFRKANLSMDQCISNYPLCSPYRAMLMTGQWPFQNGITRNWIELGTGFRSIAHAFNDAGYRTSYVGKWHLSGPGFDRAFVPAGAHRQGFQDWHVWGAVDRHMNVSFTFNPATGEKIQPEGYQSTLMTDQAVKIIQEHQAGKKAGQQGQPWMMIVSWHPPHFPVDDAPQADEAYFADKQVALRPNVKAGLGKLVVETTETVEHFHQGYYAHIRAVDREFGRLLKALDETGQAQDTIVIFTSDHGEMAGSHGRMYKQLPFEESARVPFFVRYPGVTPKAKSSNAMLATIDLYPTICGLAGVPVTAAAKGKDRSDILRGKRVPGPEVVFLMNNVEPEVGKDFSKANGGGFAPAAFRGLRSATHTYAVAADGRWLLFDNVKDPYQMNNLIDDAIQKPLMEHFDGLIAAWLLDSDDPFDYARAKGLRSAAPAV